MKLVLASSLLALPAAAAATAAASGSRKTVESEASATCECQPLPPLSPSYQVTRLWNIVDPSMTPQDVANEFQSGFAPMVTHMDGFQRYTSSFTGNNTTIFFLNQFGTKEEAHAAQEAAKAFVKNGTLNGKIEPNIFTEAPKLFAASVNGCINSSSVGKYSAVRYWNLPDFASINRTELYSLFEDFFNSEVKNKEGIVEYHSAVNVPDGPEEISWNIFKTEEDAIAFNQFAASYNFTADGWPVSEFLTSTEGKIVFDYLCATGNTPKASPSAAFKATAAGAVVATAVLMMFERVF